MNNFTDQIKYGIFIILITAISLTGILLFIIAVFYPKVEPIDLSIEGVKYKRGLEYQHIEKPVKIQIKGELRTTFKGVKTYAGYFKVFEEGVNDSRIGVMNKSEAIITFKKEKEAIWGDVVYPNTNYGLLIYGRLFVDDLNSFNKISIFASEYIVSAPASSRSEALEITNSITPYNIN